MVLVRGALLYALGLVLVACAAPGGVERTPSEATTSRAEQGQAPPAPSEIELGGAPDWVMAERVSVGRASFGGGMYLAPWVEAFPGGQGVYVTRIGADGVVLDPFGNRLAELHAELAMAETGVSFELPLEVGAPFSVATDTGWTVLWAERRATPDLTGSTYRSRCVRLLHDGTVVASGIVDLAGVESLELIAPFDETRLLTITHPLIAHDPNGGSPTMAVVDTQCNVLRSSIPLPISQERYLSYWGGASNGQGFVILDIEDSLNEVATLHAQRVTANGDLIGERIVVANEEQPTLAGVAARLTAGVAVDGDHWLIVYNVYSQNELRSRTLSFDGVLGAEQTVASSLYNTSSLTRLPDGLALFGPQVLKFDGGVLESTADWAPGIIEHLPPVFGENSLLLLGDSMFQRFDAQLLPLDPVPLPVASHAARRSTPQAANNGDQHLVLWYQAWEHALTVGKWSLYGSRVDSSGAALAPLAFLVHDDINYDESLRLASNGQDYLSVWRAYVPTAGSYGQVQARRIIANGEVPDPTPLIVAAGPDSLAPEADVHRARPAVASDGRDYLVAFYRHVVPAALVFSVLGVRVTAEGQVLDSEPFLIANMTGFAVPNWPSPPLVAYDGAQYLVTYPQRDWATAQIGGELARVTADGVVLGRTVLPFEARSLSSNGDTALLTWIDGSSVRASRVDRSGSLLELDGMTLGTASDLTTITSSWDGADYRVVWNVADAGTLGVHQFHTTRVTALGEILDPGIRKLDLPAQRVQQIVAGSRSALGPRVLATYVHYDGRIDLRSDRVYASMLELGPCSVHADCVTGECNDGSCRGAPGSGGAGGSAGATSSGGAGGSAGAAGEPDSGGTSGNSATGGIAGGGAGENSGGAPSASPAAERSEGCSCRMPPRQSKPGLALALMTLALIGRRVRSSALKR